MTPDRLTVSQPGDWFDPGAFYENGFPEPVKSALSQFPEIHANIRKLLAASGSKRALEVGPGDVPLIGELPVRVYLDAAYYFLEEIEDDGAQKVVGSIVAIPFDRDTFDVAVAADVLPHVEPALRPVAIAELARVAPRILIFNQELCNPMLPESVAKSDDILKWLYDLDLDVTRIRYDSKLQMSHNKSIDMPLDVFVAARKPKVARAVTPRIVRGQARRRF